MPTLTPTPTVSDPCSFAARSYYARVGRLLPADALGRFGALMGEFGRNPSVILTDEWKLRVAVTLVEFRRASDDVKAMYVPDDAQETHVHALAVADDLGEVITHAIKGIDNIDPAAFEQVNLAASRMNANVATILATANSCMR